MKEPKWFKEIEKTFPNYLDVIRGKKCVSCKGQAETFNLRDGKKTYYCRVTCLERKK